MSSALIRDRKKGDISEEYCNPQFCLWLELTIYIVYEAILCQMA